MNERPIADTTGTVNGRTIDGSTLQIAWYLHDSAGVDAETVLLVHGFPDSHRVWDGVVLALRDRFRVATLDVRGAGASGRSPRTEDYALEFLEEDLASVCDAIAPDGGVHLVGHDWGSIQSWEFATSDSAKGRLASYTTISGPCLDHVAYWMREARGSLRGAKALASQLSASWYVGAFQLPVVPELLLRRVVIPSWPEPERTPGQHDTLAEDAMFGVNLYRANIGERRSNPQQRFAKVPVQLIVLEDDPYVKPTTARAARAWCDDITERSHPGDHWAVASDPVAIAALISDYISNR